MERPWPRRDAADRACHLGPVKEEWRPSGPTMLIRFRPDGQIIGTEAFNPDGSIARTACVYNEAGQILETRLQMNDGPVSRITSSYDGAGRISRTVNIDEKGVGSESEIYRYDPIGRKTKIQFLPKVEGNVGYSVDSEGGAALFGVSGAATMTTIYDDHDRAIEVTVHDAVHRLLRRTTLTRDSAGRLLKQEVLAGTTPVFPEFEDQLKNAPPEDRESIQAALAAAFGPNNVLVTVTNRYDEKGRRVERTMTMGTLGGDRTTFNYDDHDNPIEEITEEPSKEYNRCIYKYDAQGNWTERGVGTVVEPGKDYRRSDIERRQITYNPPEPH
jgi:hypothetical protein